MTTKQWFIVRDMMCDNSKLYKCDQGTAYGLAVRDILLTIECELIAKYGEESVELHWFKKTLAEIVHK